MGEGSLEVRRDTYPRLQDTGRSHDFSMNRAICSCSFKSSPKVAAAGSICSEEQQPRALREWEGNILLILPKMVSLRCWPCSYFRIWWPADVQMPGAWGECYPSQLTRFCHFETWVSRGRRNGMSSPECQGQAELLLAPYTEGFGGGRQATQERRLM